eukprot:g1576.t2
MKRATSRFFEGVRHDDGKIVVIKVGTSSLVDPAGGTLVLSNLARICEASWALRQKGHIVLLVSSGAVGVGCQQLKLKSRPSNISQKQALAAVGQVHLMRYYDEFFSSLGLSCAQILLTNDNFVTHHHFLNARNTFLELMSYGVVPIVNENDTIAVEQLCIGDNDTLAARVAIMCEADWLVMCTDVDCLYTANPRDDPSAKAIHEVHDISTLDVDIGSLGTQWGTGGMGTKLTAAKLVTAAGCNAAICHSKHPERIMEMIEGQKVGTKFFSHKPERGRKRWILSVPVNGSVWLDNGAVDAVRDNHASLFAAGIVKLIGSFQRDDSVSICNNEGKEFARGVVNYSNKEMEQVMGKGSESFANRLNGYSADEMIHRNNICLLQSK